MLREFLRDRDGKRKLDTEKLRRRPRGLLRDRGGGAGGQVGRERVGGGFFVPEDAEDVPAVLVVEELDGVDAAGEGFFVGGVAGFVAAEDLGHVAEAVDFVDDGVFVEGVGFEVAAGEVDVFVGG